MPAQQFEVPKNVYRGSWCFHVTLAQIAAAGDVITQFTPGFPASIVKAYAIVCDPVTTGSKAATLNIEIGSTNLSGGTIALTSAGLATLGTVVNCTAIAGSNSFSKTDTISVEASSVTAFAEGAIILVIEYQGKVMSGGAVAPEFAVPANTFRGAWCHYMVLSDITDADQMTNFIPGFPGRIVKTFWVQDVKNTTASDGSTLNLEINAVNVDGGVVVLDSDVTTAQGVVIDGTTVTGKNNFDADDTISVEASSTAAFAEGTGTLVIEYEGKILKS